MSGPALSTQQTIPELSYTNREIKIVVIAACIGWGLEFFDLNILSLYATSIMKTFNITPAAFGAIASIQLVGTALGGILFGILADKYGRRKMLTWTIMIFSVATFLTAFAGSVEALSVFRFVTGLGIGGEWAIGFSLLNEAWNPKQRGLMGGIVQGSIWPAYAIAIFVSQVVANWRLGFAIGVFPALAAVWIRLKCPESKVWLNYNKLKLAGELPSDIQDHAKRATFVQIFQKDVIRYTILGTILCLGTFYASLSSTQWIPTLLTQNYHLTVAVKSIILYAGSAVSLVAYISAGWLSDRYGRKKIFVSYVIILLIGFIMLTAANMYMKTVSAVAVSYLVISLGLGTFGIFGAWFSEIFPTRVRATGSSFAYNVGRGLASASPLIIGIVATANSLELGISTCIISLFVVLIAVPFMVDSKGRSISSVE
jgi:MFS family permease